MAGRLQSQQAAARRERNRLRTQARKITRLLRTMPDAVREEIAPVLQDIAQTVYSRAVAAIRQRSGMLASALSQRVARNTLSARVGVIGKVARRRAFYARFVELGTPSRQFQRGARKGSPRTPVRARPFLGPAWYGIRNLVTPRIAAAIGRALSRTRRA